MPKRVCLYARVSKTSQSVERQISELEIVAARNGWEIVDRYIDHGISGATGRDQRHELDRMMKDSTKRKFDVVMVWSIDRLGRSLQNLIEILNDLNSKNIDLYMDQQSIDSTTPTGKLMFSLIGAFAEFEKSTIRDRVISGLANARKKGRIGGRPTNLTDEIQAKILEMKSAGASIRKIKEECSVGTATIYKVLRAEPLVLEAPCV
ncbi:MAG TPA: recombinase family protein [Desulfobacterales bacterium]|nr:recombinase family protein [Desulfobacterales bacterium]